MAGNHSMDIVSKVNMQEVTNAVNQAMMEIKQRYDFKGSVSKIELNSKENKLVLASDDEFKMKSVVDILQNKLVKRSVSLKALVYGKLETASGGTVRQEATLQQGIPADKAKDMVKQIKNMKLKVQAQIREMEVRVSGKKIDDLQNIIDLLKEKDFGLPLQFENYR
ncbi:MAG: YajQ family cyclic di-GMP-binding protein [Nitrospinota bacterium]|nr:YajQ family cyclic di-GMP-binding protein [Nitrospinota bacterium]